MPITVVCTKCSAKLNAPDNAAGKKVKCPKAGCGAVVAIPAPLPLDLEDDDNSPPAPAPKRSSAVVANAPARAKPPAREESTPAAGNDPFKFDAGEDTPKSPRAKRKRADDDDEERPTRKRTDDDDEEERPTRNRRRPADDDEDEDRPRKTQRKKEQPKGLSPVIIAAIAGGALLLLVGGGLAVYFLTGSSKDKDTASAGSGGGGSSNGGGSSTGFTSKAAVPAGWVEFNEAGFKAYFPAKPRGMNDGDEKVYMTVDGTINFLVVVKRQAVLIDPSNRKQVVDEFIDKTFKESEAGKILSRKDATLADQPATELLTTAPDEGGGGKAQPAKGSNPKSKSGVKDNDPGRGVFRIVAKGNQVYVVGVLSKNGTPASEQVNAFFDNFEFVDENAKPKSKPSDSPKPSDPPMTGDPLPTTAPPKTADTPSPNPNPPPSTASSGDDKPSKVVKITEEVAQINKSTTEALSKCTDSATAQTAAKTLKENTERLKKLSEDIKAVGMLSDAEINEVRTKTPPGNAADTKAAMGANQKVQRLLQDPKSKLSAVAKTDLSAAMKAWGEATLAYAAGYIGIMLPPKK